MLNKLRANQNQKGFTLIELMIVIAIIGILAAIAMPQFMAYRMRGYHSTALADVRNWSATQAAMMQDGACYGVSSFATTLLAPAGSFANGGVGARITGGASVQETRMATDAVDGMNLTGSRNDGQAREIRFSFPVGVGDGVRLRADASQSTDLPLYSDSFLLWSEHQKGIRGFAVDSDVSTTVFFTEDDTWSGANPAAFNFATVAVVVGQDDLTPGGTGSLKASFGTWQVLK